MCIESQERNYKITVVMAIICLGWCITSVCAADEKLSSVSNPYITIDPIGNHTVTEIFFVNGTTNLPVGEPLHVHSFIGSYQPGPNHGSGIDAYTSVEPGYGGVNIWSCNISPVLWVRYNGYAGETHDFKLFMAGDYAVTVDRFCPPNFCSPTNISNEFTISSVNSGITSDLAPTGITPVTPVQLSTSLVTTNTSSIPPTPSVPVSGAVPVLAVVTMIILWAGWCRP